ncbi:MAG: BREX-4 system phosphatase PglZ, partial [Fervidobacterium sp.]
MSIYGAKWTEGATVEFASYTDVCKQIINETDRETLSHRRFPLRFIFSNSAEDIRNIINSVHCELGARVLNISEVLNNDEQWPTRDEICRLIKNTETDTVLIALSEYLRFLNDTDFSSFLYAISSIEKPNVRVFIPMLGLWERFYALFWKEFYRAKEWAPVWRISSAPNKHTKIYCLQFNTDNLDSKLEGSLPGCKLVKSVSEWFSTYLQTEVEKIIIVSKVLNMLSKNASSDNAVDFRLLQDQKQLLEEVYGLEVPIDYNENEKRYWTQLFHLISQQRRDFSNSFLKIVEYHFNVHDMSSLSLGKIVRLIEQASDFDIWLLAKTLPKVNKSNEYLNICLSSLDSFKQEKLISKLWFKIFSFKSEHLSQKTCDERRDILREITRAMSDPEELIPDLEKELSTLLNKLDKREVIKYLTGLTSYERELIIKLLLEVDSKDGIRDELMKLYPELKYYIDWESIKLSIDAPEWIIRYFTLYNFSKLQNKKHEEIDTILNKFNHNKESFSEWYIHLNLVLKLIEDKGREMSSGTLRYIWIDGLGAEWLPLIANLVEKSGKATITFKALARVSLPSTTKCNRYEYEKIADLDNFVHSQSSYKHPECLVKEIEIIEKIVDKILRYPEERIIVVSDHGFSFLCTKEHGSY